ncbi:hypothetical protein BH23VER1_BH23VER1_11470 [soil metagenome]
MVAVLIAVAFVPAAVKGERSAHPELGTIGWGRDLGAALTASARSGKPVLLLFQEVPGCAGCKAFGREVLSNPGIVKAAHEAFEPVAIFNNRGGADREILERYKEPAWNYQVVRFVDAEGKDIIPRKDKVWSTGALAERMMAALQKAGRPVPGYLAVLAGRAPEGIRSARDAREAPREAVFAMSCFWEGEARLGRVAGVLETEAGWLGGREVVKVVFDPATVGAAELVKAAEKLDCAQASHFAQAGDAGEAKAVAKNSVGTGLRGYRVAAGRDQKIYLRRSPYSGLALSPQQATKLNAAVRFGQGDEVAAAILTEKQRAKVAKE